MSLQQQRIDNILNQLDEKQRYAATREDGKYLLLAGAGSGKSRTVIHRVAYLIEKGVNPWEIVSISFTNKAANELVERLTKLVGEKSLEVNTGTFHSLCTRILLRNQGALNMENMTILSEDDSDKIIRELSENYGYMKDATYDIKKFISHCGNEGYYPEDMERLGYGDKFPRDYISIFTEYTEHKRHVGYVDFDDLLGLTYKLFKLRPDILNEYASRYRYIIIDEAQDNSSLMMKIMQQLASHHGNYMVVGDEDQSIYKFRGADVYAFIGIQEEDNIETILLEQNYRSTSNIVNGSNSLIEKNKERLNKVAYTNNKPGAQIFLYQADDNLRESQYVADMIKNLVRETNLDYDDFAVLYRSNYLSQDLSLTLSSAGIPYEVNHGTNFYDREEIKTLVSYLRILENPLDDIALEYVINRPKRGIGETTINRLKMYAAGINLPLSATLEHVDDIPKINKPTKKKIKEFDELIKGARTLAQETDKITNVLQYIIVHTEFMGQYDSSKTKDLQSIELIQELFNIAVSFDGRQKVEVEGTQTILTQFLTETALYSSPEEEDMGRVTLSTVHGSKGIEFKCVFIVGLQQGTFPSYLSASNEDIEEERRLLYVAMTRAEEMLFMSYNKFEYRYGKMDRAHPSMFIDELAKEYIQPLGNNAKK